MRARIVIAVLASVVLVAIAVVWAATRPESTVQVDSTVNLHTPGLLVRDTSTGHLALVRADGSRGQTKAECSRAYASAGRAVCMFRDPAGVFRLSVLDESLNPIKEFPIAGVPTRARVSGSGRMIAWTVFVSGDSYLSSGFSTRTGVLDLQSGRVITTLEDFRIDGKKLPIDANFWGISFAGDDNTFYSTMATGDHLYLVRGDFAAGTLVIMDDGVECPSLSPDERRLVYKKRLPDSTWQLWVYDLGTGERTQLAEPGNVDDQGAWLDAETVAYGKIDENSGQVNVWSVPADGTGAPRLIAENAESPAGI